MVSISSPVMGWAEWFIRAQAGGFGQAVGGLKSEVGGALCAIQAVIGQVDGPPPGPGCMEPSLGQPEQSHLSSPP